MPEICRNGGSLCDGKGSVADRLAVVDKDCSLVSGRALSFILFGNT